MRPIRPTIRPLAAALAVALAACQGCGADKRTVAPTTVPPDTASADAHPLVVLQPTTTYQTIVGWEAASESGHESGAFPLYRDTLMSLAAGWLGINRIRLEVRAGAENTHDYWGDLQAGKIDYSVWRCARYAVVNDDADPNHINPAGFVFSELDAKVDRIVLPLKQKVEARGEHLFLNLQYVAFTQGSCPGMQMGQTGPDEYAEFILAATLHLRDKYHLVPDAWEALLEADNGTNYGNGTLLGQAIAAAGARLSAAGFTPQFIAPSTKSMSQANSFYDAMLAVPGAAGYVKELAYHRYSGVSAGALDGIRQRAEAHGIRTAMLEKMGAGYEELHTDLRDGRDAAWQQFTLAYPTSDNGAQYFIVDTTAPGHPKVIPGKRTTFLRQYFAYVRAGARRVGATSEEPDMDPLAFVNADGKTVVVVKASSGGDVYVKGLPAGRYGVSYTTSDAANVDAGEVTLAAGHLVHAGIPAAGVLTVYAK